MTTTIQISDDTAKTLKHLRTQYNLESYDEVIQKIIRKSRPSKSMYGFLKPRIPLKELLHDLRDKRDRF